MDRFLGRLLLIVVAILVRPQAVCAQGCDAPGICAKGKVCGTNKTMKSGHVVCFNNCCYDPDNDKPGASAICCNIGLSEDGEAGIGWCCPKYHSCGQADRSGKASGPLCICEGGMKEGVCQCADAQKCGAFCCKQGWECVHGECKPWCKTETARGASRVFDPATQCCTEHGIEKKFEPNVSRCEKTKVAKPGFKPTANGCGTKDKKVPDEFTPAGASTASFLKACNAHDLCYGTCGSKKQDCDNEFEKALKKVCNTTYKGKGKASTTNRKKCLEMATTYSEDGRVVASLVGAFDDAQKEACQCCP